MDLNYEKDNYQTGPIVEKKVFSYLGLATRAGALASGEFMTEKVVKAGTAKLVIVATDASDNTKKNVYQYVYLL